MSKANNTWSNYYNQDNDTTLEKAELLEAVSFSADGFEPVNGKFRIQILTPNAADSTRNTRGTKSGNKSNYITLSIPSFCLIAAANPKCKPIYQNTDPKSDKYTYLSTSNVGTRFNMLYCDNHTSMKYTIPAGSIFYVEIASGYIKAENIKIIGMDTSIKAKQS